MTKPMDTGERPPRRAAFDLARRVIGHLSPSRRAGLRGVIALMLVGAVAELATVGAVIPFLLVVTAQDGSGRVGAALDVLDRVGRGIGVDRLALAAAALVIVALVAGAIRLLLAWQTQRVVFGATHELATEVYARTLEQPYSYHVATNSSETVAAVDAVQQVFGGVFLPALAGLTAAVISGVLVIGLVAVDPWICLVACGCFGALYLAFSIATGKRLADNSRVMADATRARVRTLMEGMGGIRDILVDRSQAVFVRDFATADGALRSAQASSQFIATTPRYVIDAGGVMLVALVALYVGARQDGLVGALPTLGALALGVQRLLPQVQQMFASWAQVRSNGHLLSQVLALIELPTADPVRSTERMPRLRDALTLENVSFTYAGGARPALDGIDLTIARGMRVGLMGRSGSGKSTLADILLGLLPCTAGRMRVDGRTIDAAAAAGWQAQVAHVPQAIFLADATIAANIAFGQSAGEVDAARVAAAVRDADLAEFVETLPNGLQTVVGERGVRLSGGQRQRIGIARALYKRASVLILDEATSALDDETEAAVMGSIAALSRDLTIVMIAHRITTLRGCDMVVRLEGGRVMARGSYEAVISPG